MKTSENRPREAGGGYINGLITGAMVGAAAVFLSSTKYGRRLSKKMRLSGKTTFAELEKLVDEIKQKEMGGGEKAKTDKKDLSYIEQLQEKGRAVAQNFFKRDGKTLG